MISLEKEIASLRERDLIKPDVAATLIALERREVISLHTELRVALWLAVALITSGVGFFLKENIDRIGHLTLIVLIGLAAIASYVVVWDRRRAGSASSALDYLVLLGALLLSADIGYAESQFHLFDESWRHHLLLLAVVHAATAYAYDSRLVLSLAITSLAGWFGIDNRGEFLEGDAWDVARRLLFAAMTTLVWRVAHTRAGRLPHFRDVFDHFIAHFALLGALVLIFEEDYTWFGAPLLVATVTAAIVWGIRQRREPFVIYGFIYGVIGFDAFFAHHIDSERIFFFWLVMTTPIAIAALFVIHRRWRKEW